MEAQRAPEYETAVPSRTAQSQAATPSLGWPWVAYEVDGVEPDEQGGWSVLVVGRAEELTEPSGISRVAEQRHVLWTAGESARWLRIVPSKITGQRISAVSALRRRQPR